MREEIEAAGFQLARESDFLRNAADRATGTTRRPRRATVAARATASRSRSSSRPRRARRTARAEGRQRCGRSPPSASAPAHYRLRTTTAGAPGRESAAREDRSGGTVLRGDPRVHRHGGPATSRSLCALRRSPPRRARPPSMHAPCVRRVRSRADVVRRCAVTLVRAGRRIGGARIKSEVAGPPAMYARISTKYRPARAILARSRSAVPSARGILARSRSAAPWIISPGARPKEPHVSRTPSRPIGGRVTSWGDCELSGPPRSSLRRIVSVHGGSSMHRFATLALIVSALVAVPARAEFPFLADPNRCDTSGTAARVHPARRTR